MVWGEFKKKTFGLKKVFNSFWAERVFLVKKNGFFFFLLLEYRIFGFFFSPPGVFGFNFKN